MNGILFDEKAQIIDKALEKSRQEFRAFLFILFLVRRNRICDLHIFRHKPKAVAKLFLA